MPTSISWMRWAHAVRPAHALQNSGRPGASSAGGSRAPNWILGSAPDWSLHSGDPSVSAGPAACVKGSRSRRRTLQLIEEEDTPEAIAYLLGWTAEAHYHAHDADAAYGLRRRGPKQSSRALGEGAGACRVRAHGDGIRSTHGGPCAGEAVGPARQALVLFARAETVVLGVAARAAWRKPCSSRGESGGRARPKPRTRFRCAIARNAETPRRSRTGILARVLLRRRGCGSSRTGGDRARHWPRS